VYLATVIDAHSRRVIGWAIDEHMRADLVQDALAMAITLRGDLPAKVVFHSGAPSTPRPRSLRSPRPTG
jgi:putative transposase